MIRMAKPSRAQCMRLPRRERRRIARRRTERISSAMRERQTKRARVGCYLLVQLGPMVQDKEHTRSA